MFATRTAGLELLWMAILVAAAMLAVFALSMPAY
jgi:hypothetical protein